VHHRTRSLGTWGHGDVMFAFAMGC
jgi:hypothetical protein